MCCSLREFVFSKIKKNVKHKFSKLCHHETSLQNYDSVFPKQRFEYVVNDARTWTRAEGEEGTGHAIRWTRNCGVFESFV